MTENKPNEKRLWFTTKDLAEAFFVTPRTIRRWVRAKLLQPRYRLRGGTCYEVVFLNSEVVRFMDEYLPTGKDLGDPTASKTRSRKDRVETMRRLKNMHRLYIGRVNAMRTAKDCGLEGGKLESQEKEPVIVGERPQRRQLHARRERQGLREVGSRRDGEDYEEEPR